MWRLDHKVQPKPPDMVSSQLYRTLLLSSDASASLVTCKLTRPSTQSAKFVPWDEYYRSTRGTRQEQGGVGSGPGGLMLAGWVGSQHGVGLGRASRAGAVQSSDEEPGLRWR